VHVSQIAASAQGKRFCHEYPVPWSGASRQLALYASTTSRLKLGFFSARNLKATPQTALMRSSMESEWPVYIPHLQTGDHGLRSAGLFRQCRLR
jgi:hypothetical protein